MPKKLGCGVAFTRELVEHSSAEAVITNVIAADLSLIIDSVLFDATAADTTRPAGLKNGIGATAATAGATIDSMFADMANLAAIVSAQGGMNLCFIASVKQAIKMQLRKSQNAFPFPVYASAGLADGCVAALAFDALCVAGDTEPRFEFSPNAVFHMEDTAPLQISTAGPVIASPVQSMYQQDLIGLRVITDLTWGLRSTTGFAYITAVNW
jgi:hypothetical protein